MHYVRCCVPLGLLLVFCAGPGQTQEKKPMIYDSSLYPLAVGNQWHYKVTVGDAPVQKVIITVEQQEIFNYKFTQDKKEVIEPIIRFRLKVVSGTKELTEHVAVLSDGVYRFTTAGKDITPPLRFLKLPSVKGDTWVIDSISENVPLTGTFTCEDDGITVPAGQFQTKRISCPEFQLGTDKMSLEAWYAPNFGMVQQKVRAGNSDVLLELEEFKKVK